MENWPYKTFSTQHAPKRRKAKSQIPNEIPGYPIIEHGAITSANVCSSEKNHLEWSFLCEDNTNRRLDVIRNPVKIFPATRRIPAQSKLNATQTADQATQFLRLHYPDADFPQDIIKDHIVEDLDTRRRLDTFDPYSGNVLATLPISSTSRRPNVYIAFAMGESGAQLNISPLSLSGENGLVFKPISQPVWDFTTPVLQLVSTGVSTPSNDMNAVLAARTYFSTTFLEVTTDPIEPALTSVCELGLIANKQTGDRPTVDFLIRSGGPTHSLLVNDKGAVYSYTLETRAVFEQISQPTYNANDGFFRLSQGPDNDTYFLLASNDVVSIDLREPKMTQTIHRCRYTDVFTDFTYTSQTDLLSISSASEVLWLDRRYSKRPLFAIKHYRKHDRHLQIGTVHFGDDPLTFLTSRRNGLITMYDVSKGSDNLLHLHTLPYVLPSIPIVESARTGHLWLQHPDERKDRASLLQLSDRGSLHRMDLQFSTSVDKDVVRFTDGGYEWSDLVTQIEKEIEKQMEDPGPSGERGYEETDLDDAYKTLFCEDTPEEDTSAPYDILDAMPTFWRQQEGPVEHMLTSYDIAFRSGSEPRDPSRADFFTGTALDSTRGYRAMKQGRIPVDILKKSSKSHYDTHPIYRRFVPDMQGGSDELHQQLSRYDLLVDDVRPPSSIYQEAEAKDQLALDLSLSTDVFSSRTIKTTSVDSVDDDVDNMSAAAEAMTLGVTEPPQVKFGFLDPVPVEDAEMKFTDLESSPSEDDSQPLKLPLGVRLLLSEWRLGEDPQEYTYADPYDASAKSSRPIAQQPRKRTPPPVAPQPSRIQKPPTIAVKSAPAAPPVIATTQPSRPALVPTVPRLPQSQQPPSRIPQSGSQPTHTGWDNSSQSRSQIPVMSTQVLPGLHGGRPQPVKKKPPKKRVGGF